MADDPELAAIPALISILEGLDNSQRTRVLRFIFEKLNIQIGDASQAESAPSRPNAASDLDAALGTKSESEPSRPHITDIRTLAEKKQPQTASEMVALVAYYLEHLAPKAERRNYITTDDVRPFFKDANFELPKAPPAMTLAHAKNAGYLKALARGQYQLNPVGYNLVVHKLGTEAAAAEPRRRTKPGRASAKKKRH
jgi:hypothetical protein